MTSPASHSLQPERPVLPSNVHNTDDVHIRTDASTSSKPVLGFISQASCHLHRYTRNEYDAHIVERADRLRSIFMGVSLVHGRIVAAKSAKGKEKESIQSQEVSDLEKMLGGLNIGASKSIHDSWPFSILSTSRKLPLDSEAVSLVHGQEYSRRLSSYISDVSARHENKESEVPEPLSQGDLYLCKESKEALEGALGACCEAVDQICTEKSPDGARRFVSIRPPGHHCESENPMGFCWVNNVAVAAAHAHLQHDVDRVIILDIDLHHGNGTQEIAWRLNALAHKAIQDRNKASSPRKGSPKKAVASSLSSKPILQVFYGSLHDVDSYPCEELDPVLIANASVNISGGGGSQYITNVHLEPYTDDKDFHDRLYPIYAKRLLGCAKEFLLKTTAAASRTVVIVSAGFDASEHEYASMSRHGAKVPTSFFSRFARDAVNFARENAGGKLLAVLEGGYSQRALLSGAASFMSGLLDDEDLLLETIDSWWMTKQLEIYEKTLGPVVTRGKRAGMSPAKNTSQAEEDWRTPALSMYAKLKETIPAQPADAKVKTKPVTPPTSSVRATRSRYNSPAMTAKTESAIESPVPSIAVESPLNLKEVAPITPVASPLPDKPKPSTVFPGATPLIRFTFKAGESKTPQPIVGTGQYRDAGRDSSTSGDGDTSGSE